MRNTFIMLMTLTMTAGIARGQTVDLKKAQQEQDEYFKVMMKMAEIQGQKPLPHFGVKEDAEEYPQDTPVACLRSVLKCLEKKDYSYLFSNLYNPSEVSTQAKHDAAIQEANSAETQAALGKITGLLKEYLSKDPKPIPAKQFTVFVLKKGIQTRLISFTGKKWYMADFPNPQ